jgi:hypothetical protein
MKILFTNKFFYPKGGSETVFFQEKEFLLNNEHKVIDFSMKHAENCLTKVSTAILMQIQTIFYMPIRHWHTW